MNFLLDDAEVRVLGCLIEKELATPEYYPLSLNALANACNQKTNRDPVVSYEEKQIEKALEGLEAKGLARRTALGSRVEKHLHLLLDRFDLSRQHLAVLCELLIRGPQTVGELRSRAGRMADFADLAAVEHALAELTDHEPPLVERLPRDPGRKENRFTHRFAARGGSEADGAHHEPVQGSAVGRDDDIALLRRDLDDLRKAFDEFRARFE